MGKAVSKENARSAAIRGLPVEKYGLKFWAIPMSGYEEWAKCKDVWMARQSRFPVTCISMTFLEALFAMDLDAIERTGKPHGLVYGILYGLGLALRLGEDCVRKGNIYLSSDEEQRKLNGIAIKMPEGNRVEISPKDFNTVRKLVLWMQGDDVPDESENDELLEAERDLAQRGSPPLNYDLTDMEAAVGLAYGCRIRDVMEWSILEFETSRRAIQRDKKHLLCGIGETNGCKWEGGNPYPSWIFDRAAGTSGALIAQNQFGKMKTNKKE